MKLPIEVKATRHGGIDCLEVWEDGKPLALLSPGDLLKDHRDEIAAAVQWAADGVVVVCANDYPSHVLPASVTDDDAARICKGLNDDDAKVADATRTMRIYWHWHRVPIIGGDGSPRMARRRPETVSHCAE